MVKSLKTELDKKDLELEMKDVETDSQKKKIECLLIKVCDLYQKLKSKRSECDHDTKLQTRKRSTTVCINKMFFITQT